MNIFRLFYDSIFHYSKTLYAYRMRFWARIGYWLLLGIVMLLPMIWPVSQAMDTWDTNRTAIIESVPSFKTDGTAIQTDAKPFVNRTDFLTYTFDPEDKIDQTTLGDPQDAMLTFKTGQHAFSVMVLNQEVLNFPYDGRKADSDVQKAFIEQATAVPRSMVYLAAYVSGLFSSLINALMLAVIFGFMRMSQQLQLTFGRKFNFAMVAMTLSTVISSLLGLVIPSFVVGQSMLVFLVAWIQLYYLSTHTRIIPIDRDQWQQQHQTDDKTNKKDDK